MYDCSLQRTNDMGRRGRKRGGEGIVQVSLLIWVVQRVVGPCTLKIVLVTPKSPLLKE